MKAEYDKHELVDCIKTPLGAIYYDTENCITLNEIIEQLARVLYDKGETDTLEILQQIQLNTHTIP